MVEGEDRHYPLKEPAKEEISWGKVGGVFPGQGSQSPGMGLELYQNSKAARYVFNEADDVLGFRLSKMIFEGLDNELTDTINSQPAILVVSIASLEALREILGDNTPKPLLLAGHSLGEYTSMIVAGVTSFSDGVRLVRERGRLMKQASENRPGGMAAILGLDQSVLEEVCAEVGVEIGNINSDDQLIISGDKIAVGRAMDLASARGAKKTLPLAVSGAFHSSLMEGARDELASIINGMEFNDPNIPIVGNSNAQPLTTAQEVKEELIDGLCKCVQWRDAVKFMAQSGVTHFIEFGPGRVLSALIKRIDKSAQAFNIDSPGSIQKLVNAMAI